MSDTAVWALAAVVVSAMALAGWLQYLKRDNATIAKVGRGYELMREEFAVFKEALSMRFEGTTQGMLTSVDLMHRESVERLTKVQADAKEAYEKVLAELDKASVQYADAFEKHVEFVELRCARTEAGLRAVNHDFSPTGKRFDPKLNRA